MPFELEQMTKVRVLDVRVLSKKDRKPGDPAGLQLLLRASLSADALTMFDGAMKGQFYRRQAGPQGALDGMEGMELTPFASHVKRLPWEYEQTGCAVVIDHGTGGKSNIVLSDCKTHRVSISPQQGGSAVVQWAVDAPALSNATRGTVTDLKSTDIEMTLTAPEVDGATGQQSIDDKKPPAKTAAKTPAKAANGKAATVSNEGAWPWPFGTNGDKNAPNTGKTPEQALADSVGAGS